MSNLQSGKYIFFHLCDWKINSFSQIKTLVWMKDYFLSKSKNTEFFDDSPVNFFLIVIIILCVMHSSTWVSYPTTENGENASNTSFPHYVRGVWNCNNYQSVWICVWEKLALGNHIITLTPLFSKSSIFKMFSVQKKMKSLHFQLPLKKSVFGKHGFHDRLV